MPRLADLRDHIDEQIELALRVAADEHRAGHREYAEKAMLLAQGCYRDMEAIGLLVGRRVMIEATARQTLRAGSGIGQRIRAALAVLIGGR